jgi:serine/threonine-protein kinase
VAFNCLTGTLPFPSESAQETMIMRLTDQPKTLAEMRPDIAWPAELQAVMDKVLSRDVNLRYQKSSDFGRDMAKAVEHMPAVVAAQAGTMVMGSAPAAAAPAAPTAALPKTRLAAKSSGTAKMEVPAAAHVAAAPAKKSPAMMIVAAVVVIAAAGGGYALLGGKKDAAVTPPNPGNAQANKPADTTAKTADAGKPIETKSQGSKQPAEQMKKALVSIPVTSAPAPTGPAPTAAESPTAVVSYWNSKLNDAAVTGADARDALDAVNPLVPKLSGVARSNASYVQFLAYNQLADQDRVCRAAKDVMANDPTAALPDSTKWSAHVKVVSSVMSFCK